MGTNRKSRCFPKSPWACSAQLGPIQVYLVIRFGFVFFLKPQGHVSPIALALTWILYYSLASWRFPSEQGFAGSGSSLGRSNLVNSGPLLRRDGDEGAPRSTAFPPVQATVHSTRQESPHAASLCQYLPHLCGSQGPVSGSGVGMGVASGGRL